MVHYIKKSGGISHKIIFLITLYVYRDINYGMKPLHNP